MGVVELGGVGKGEKRILHWNSDLSGQRRPGCPVKGLGGAGLGRVLHLLTGRREPTLGGVLSCGPGNAGSTKGGETEQPGPQGARRSLPGTTLSPEAGRGVGVSAEHLA